MRRTHGIETLKNCVGMYAVVSIYVAAASAAPAAKPPTTQASCPRIDGYRGIWWGQEPTKDAYSYKYSGGLGTYTADHVPMAWYAREVDKTFFVYGGTSGAAKNSLVAMVSYFDHAARTVPKPVVVHVKNTSDPHDNPAMMLDEKGHVWVVVSGRGRQRPGYIYRSRQPYSIDAFERIEEGELTYPQPWCVPGQGFFFLFTKYLGGRQLFWRTGPDGKHWSEDHLLAAFGGHYQVSGCEGTRIVSTFNFHPGGDVDKRTNLYYVETRDFGKSWQNAAGETAGVPLKTVKNAALVHDYEADKRLVYISDLSFDPNGKPIILYIESRGWHPGPENGERVWTTAHWTGKQWDRRPVTTSDHNYDMGSLYVEGSLWRIIAPTGTGPQPWHTGGEMVLWESKDEGQTWRKVREITHGSRFNHTYARRPVNAHPEFYAFWADGDPSRPSESRLYFTGREGQPVYVLPYTMRGATASPETYGGAGE